MDVSVVASPITGLPEGLWGVECSECGPLCLAVSATVDAILASHMLDHGAMAVA